MPSPPCGKGVWHRAQEGGGGMAQAAWGPPILPRSFRVAEPRDRLAGAEAERGREWAWLGLTGQLNQRAALGPAGRPAGSREVDKAAAAFDVSGELILNRYKMAEGDEAARRQPQQGLRRRRQSSDSSVGVNHVSSTTSLGTGQRGRGHGGRESGRPRPLGVAGTGRPVGSKTAAGWARLSPLRLLAGSLARLQGLASAAPRAPPRGLRGRPAGLGSHSWRVNGQPGPLPAAAAWLPWCPPRPEGAALSRGRGPGSRGGPQAVRSQSPGGHSLPSVPCAGRERRDERDALGPSAAAAEDAGTAATWLPGRRALSTHTLPDGSRSPQARAGARALLHQHLDPPNAFGRVVHGLARVASVGFGCQTGVWSPGAASHSLQAESVWYEVT